LGDDNNKVQTTKNIDFYNIEEYKSYQCAVIAFIAAGHAAIRHRMRWDLEYNNVDQEPEDVPECVLGILLEMLLKCLGLVTSEEHSE
jgi:hypothetical protein